MLLLRLTVLRALWQRCNRADKMLCFKASTGQCNSEQDAGYLSVLETMGMSPGKICAEYVLPRTTRLLNIRFDGMSCSCSSLLCRASMIGTVFHTLLALVVCYIQNAADKHRCARWVLLPLQSKQHKTTKNAASLLKVGTDVAMLTC